jgi:excisionase family DNA binding protein
LLRTEEPIMTAENRSTFLTVAEVADGMRLSKATVYRLVQAQEIPAVRFGRSYRVAEAAVADYIARAGLAGGGGPEAPDDRPVY